MMMFTPCEYKKTENLEQTLNDFKPDTNVYLSLGIDQAKLEETGIVSSPLPLYNNKGEVVARYTLGSLSECLQAKVISCSNERVKLQPEKLLDVHLDIPLAKTGKDLVYVSGYSLA